MKLWMKIALGLILLVILTQIPFIRNRWQTGNLAEKISALEAERIDSSASEFRDYKGVIHTHTSIGGHSTGAFDELLDATARNDLDFVVMTEHISEFYDTSAMTLRGVHGGALFIGGSELSAADENRFLVLDGFPELKTIYKLKTREFLAEIRARERVAFVTYPENFKSWNEEIDGIEVFSLHTSAKEMNPVLFFFDAIWSYGAYPELMLAGYFKRPAENLRRFDELSRKRRLTLFAGSDAHSNLGFHLFGDDAGNKFFRLKFDPYETIFRVVRTHVVLPRNEDLNRENLLRALKNGRTFIGFDILSDANGFSFTATGGTADEPKTMGDEIPLAAGGEVDLRAAAPQRARFVLFKDGEKIFERHEATEMSFQAKEEGAYRVEVYLDNLGNSFTEMPWIISNPIYIR